MSSEAHDAAQDPKGRGRTEKSKDASENDRHKLWPSWIRWWRACLGMLGMAALVVAVIGYSDSVDATGLAARITGIVFLLVGLLGLVAIGTGWTKREWAWQGGGAAALALLLVSLWTLGATMIPWPRQLHLVAVAAASTFVATVAMITLTLGQRLRESLKSGSGTSRVDERRLGNGGGDKRDRAAWIGASATICAASIALPLAWYSAQYLPAHTPPSVSINTELRDIQKLSDQGVVMVAVTVKNTGHTSARIIGSMYTLSGSAIS